MSQAIFPSSHWGSNIGNVFFYLGSEYILKNSLPDLEVVHSDMPPLKAFGLTDAQYKNDIGYGYRLGRFEYLVLDGPMFDKSFEKLFGPYLRRAKELGIRVILMSTGGIDYDAEEIQHCREVLKKYPPYILTTRDRKTFDNYADLCERSYDGICSAWFVSDAYPGYKIPDEAPYVSLCFDHALEPTVTFTKKADGSIKLDSVQVGEVAHSKIQKVLRLTQRNLHCENDGFEIIRPCHQVLNRQNWRLFFKPNSFCSQTPFGYLNIYKNTNLTITDRLHASVATMAYGNPARLFLKSNRAFLLDRVGAADVSNRVFQLDMDYLSEEKAKYLAWMSAALA